jgi:hypothetical protein
MGENQTRKEKEGTWNEKKEEKEKNKVVRETIKERRKKTQSGSKKKERVEKMIKGTEIDQKEKIERPVFAQRKFIVKQ